jgi:phospholipase B1
MFLLCISLYFQRESVNKYNVKDILDNCPNISAYTAPSSIHQLRINDIGVIMALGDSITAGFGIKGTAGLLNEYRGRSWNIGGDPYQITLPNFIKYYQPSVTGYSTKYHFLEICDENICDSTHYPQLDYYNSAQSGAITSKLMNQINYLRNRISDEDKEKWKMINLLIGGNDLCSVCEDDNFKPELFEIHLRDTLFELRNSFDKSLVNMILIFKVSDIYQISQQSQYCRDIHSILPSECPCAFSNPTKRALMDYYTKVYQNITYQVVHEVNTVSLNTNFTIVIQPMFAMADISNFTVDFLSTLDCFHPSLTAHQAMSISLWNNLFLHPMNKEAFVQYPVLKCPTNDSIIYTNYAINY